MQKKRKKRRLLTTILTIWIPHLRPAVLNKTNL